MDLDRLNELGFEKTPKWHSVILIVAFNKWWSIFIGIQCLATFLLCTYIFASGGHNIQGLFIRYSMDFCYIFEIACTITYLVNPKIRKLKYVKTRGWFFIFIDILSVLPTEMIYYCHIIDHSHNFNFVGALMQNRLLRIYRLFLLEHFYEIIARKLYQYVILSIFLYTFKLILIAHLLSCVWEIVQVSLKYEKFKDSALLWKEINTIYLVLLNWSGKPDAFKKPVERIIVSVAMLSGFFIVFSHFYPKIFYFSMQLFYQKALYYEEYEKVQVFFRNMVHNSKLEVEILKGFRDIWSKGRNDQNLHSLLSNIPLALRKEISTDIYWESLRHSDLFRQVSRNCKRSLSLLMTTEYHHSGDVIYYKGQDKLRMMFLTQGILQIMAEENSEFPILSFSNGTVLGELSLFFPLQSRAILKCKVPCELQVLTMAAVATVLKDYPKDKKLVLRNLHERLTLAKFTQWRKQKFTQEDRKSALFTNDLYKEDCVKWLKNQWRSIWESHERHQEVIRAKESGYRLSSWRKFFKTEIKIEYESNYLDLVVVSDLLEEKEDVACLRTTFPWSLDPSTQFFRMWYYVVLVTSVVPALVYPLFTAWTEHFPQPVFNLSFIVTLIFLIDVTLMLFTAVTTRHKTITEFSAVLRHLLQKPTFYFDIIAAVPYQFFVYFTVDIATTPSYNVGLYLHPALLKSYYLLLVKIPLGNFMDKITVFKSCLICFLLLYWMAELIQLIGVRDILHLSTDWMKSYTSYSGGQGTLRKYYVSVINALVTAFSIPDYLLYSERTYIMICSVLAKYGFFLYLSFLLSELYGVITVKIYGTETFFVLMKRISKFLESMYIPEQITERLLKGLKFQWEYDRADYLSSKISIIKAIPNNLRKEVYMETTWKTIHSCPVFQEETLDFVVEVMERSYLVAVPRGSVLVTYGHTSHLLSIIHRGYCQINSYLSRDVNADLGGAIQIGRGQIFPLLSSFCCVPSPVSVVTVTDCELIMIQMNDLLNLMFEHKFFKDLMDTLHELNMEKHLLDTKPGFLKVNLSGAPGQVEKKVFRSTFEQKGILWKFLYSVCPRNCFFNRKFFKFWDFGYSVYLIMVCWLWPCCFGLFLLKSHIIVPVLSGGKIVLIIHLIFRFFLAYFNKDGLLVTHPAFTCLNYLTSAFVTDLIRAFPIYQIYLYCYADPRQKPHLGAVLVLFIQLFFKMGYVMGFLTNLHNLINSRYIIRLLKITIGLLLSFNLFVNLMMYLNTIWIYGGRYHVVAFEGKHGRFPNDANLLRKNSLWDHYILTAHWMLCCLTTTDYNLHELHGLQLYLSYAQSFFGTIGTFFVYVWISSNSIFANIRGTLYQEKVFSFINYLKYERADDRLIEYVSSYYNFEWSQTHGENLKVLCDHLPTYLHEELVYPMYRPTFSRNRLFAEADEGFFKILAARVHSVFFNRGSVIMFQKQVQSNIFFVHKGKCFVYDWFLVLENGSIIGDIQRTGLMQNKVYALTHVEMLKITSDDFFSILNNFYGLEANFLHSMKNEENFVIPNIWRTSKQLRPVDSKDVLKAFCLKKKDASFEDESIFEDPENSFLHVKKEFKFTLKEKLRMWIIYPGTWNMRAYIALYISIAVVTLLSVPVFVSFGGLTKTAFAVIGITDFLWLLVIILTFRVGVTDNQKGDVITDFRLVARGYASRIGGLTLDVLSLIPFEVIPIGLARGVKSANGTHVAWGRILRLLRGHCFYLFMKSQVKNLENNIFITYFYVLSFFIVLLFGSVSVYIVIATEPSIVAARNDHELTKEQFFAFVMAFEYVINLVASSNVLVITPNTKNQLHFSNLHLVIYLYLKSVLISRILSLLYVKGVAIMFYKSQMLELESYLSGQEASPSVIEEVLAYRTKLLLLCRSENMPTLLTNAPTTIRILVMKDVYIEHLIKCPLFQDLERVFLDQLIARACREFYFEGQKIVEQGDVDRRMYFIHSGEVYVLGQTKDTAYVEYVVRTLGTGESFGEPQGLWFAIPSAYSYRARTLVDMLVLHSDDWMDLRRSFPEVVKKIFDKAKALSYI